MAEIVRVDIGREELRRWLSDESGLIKGSQPPVMQELVGRAVDEGLALVEPAYVYEIFAVRAVRHSRLELDGGAIDSTWFASMMAPAKLLVLAVCTIGRALEEQARAYTQDNEAPLGYFLDGVGTGLVELTRCAALAQFDDMALERGFEASLPLSPGDTPWPLAQQRRLFELLPAEALGITLSPSLIMNPLKSVSMAVGLGPDMGEAAEGSACDYCDIRDRCRLRSTRERVRK